MSNEFLSSEEHLSQPSSENAAAIAHLALGTVEVINKISQGFPIEERFRQLNMYVMTGARLHQVETLSNTIIETIKSQKIQEEPFCLMDIKRFDELENSLRLNVPQQFYENRELCREAIANGMLAGKDDVLRMIRPKDAEDDVHFYTPWRKDFLGIVDPSYFRQNSDGGCEVFLPTAFQGLYVVHDYPAADRSLPTEKMRLVAA